MAKPTKPVAPIPPSTTVTKSQTIAESYGGIIDVTEQVRDALKYGKIKMRPWGDDGGAELDVEYTDYNPYYDKQLIEYNKKQAKYLEKLKKYETDLQKWEDTREAREAKQKEEQRRKLQNEMTKLQKELAKL